MSDRHVDLPGTLGGDDGPAPEEEPEPRPAMSPAIEHLARQANELRMQNETTVRFINTYVTLDTTMPKLDFFFEHLVRIGLITERQLWEMRIEYELAFKQSLVPVERDIRRQLRRAQNQQKLAVPRPARLIGPNGQPLGSTRPKDPSG